MNVRQTGNPEEKKINITMSIPVSVHARLKKWAILNRRSLNAEAIIGLIHYLSDPNILSLVNKTPAIEEE